MGRISRLRPFMMSRAGTGRVAILGATNTQPRRAPGQRQLGCQHRKHKMRCLIQRVSHAQVDIDGRTVGKIGKGLMVLVCAMQDDGEANLVQLAKKVVNLRIFRDDAGKMNKSLLDVEGEALIVSQFTLAADTSRGNRPGFSNAAHPEMGKSLYEAFCDQISNLGVHVETGEFGADMQVSLTNDGPVTIWLEF